MDERFPDEFVTWHHKTPIGVKVDEVFGMDQKSGRVWVELARQIYCEQGEPNYRVINHFENGAPILDGYPGRISVTHTSHFFAVATLPKTPEVELSSFNPRSAMGIDAEPINREKVLKVRSKFLSEKEQAMIPENDIAANVLAWTCKEALYKAAMTPGLDFIKGIEILSLPHISDNPLVSSPDQLGEAVIHLIPTAIDLSEQESNSDTQSEENDSVVSSKPQETGDFPMKLYSYISYGCCVTIAISPKAAKFGK